MMTDSGSGYTFSALRVAGCGLFSGPSFFWGYVPAKAAKIGAIGIV